VKARENAYSYVVLCLLNRRSYSVWVRDVSAEGALVAGKYPIPTNCDVIFKRGDVFVAAHVAWSNETGAGVNFYRELSDWEVAAATVPLPTMNH
jgi:hypothetical protein